MATKESQLAVKKTHQTKPSLLGNYLVQPEPINNFINFNNVQNDNGTYGNLSNLVNFSKKVSHKPSGSVSKISNSVLSTT